MNAPASTQNLIERSRERPSMMPPTNPVLRDDNASRVGGQTGCRLSQVLQAALTSIGETKQRMSAPKPAGKFKCDDCGRLFSTKGNMMRHVQATHAGDGVKVFPCLVCGRKFKRREDLVTHGRVHTGEKPYACSHKGCGKRFARISDQRSHERIHSSDSKRYECKHCGKRFTRPYDLKKHMMNIHRQELSANGKRKERNIVADISSPGDGGARSDGIVRRIGGSKRLRVTGVEVSGTIPPRKNDQPDAAHSSQPLPVIASAAADGLVPTIRQRLKEQVGQSPRPMPMYASAAADGLVPTAQQHLQEQAEHSPQPLPIDAGAGANGPVPATQQRLQERAGQSVQPLPIAASAAADRWVPTIQHQLQGQAGQSVQPLPTNAGAGADVLAPMTAQLQQLQEQHQHNQHWRQEYQLWQRRQQLLDNRRQQQPESSESSLPAIEQGHQPLPLQPPPPTTTTTPATANATAAPHKQTRRRRVRCDAHKHCDPVAASSPNGANTVKVPRGSAGGGPMPQHRDVTLQERKIVEAFAEAKVHVHGAACGHAAVLHDNHVDFLVEGGRLECFDGKEKTPEHWVSTAAEGCVVEGGCGCEGEAKKSKANAAGSSSSNGSSSGGGSGGGGGSSSGGSSSGSSSGGGGGNSNTSSSGNSNGNSGSSCNSNSNSTNNSSSNSSSSCNSGSDSSSGNSDSSSGKKSNSSKGECCKGKSKSSSNIGNPSWKMMTRSDLIHWDGARGDKPRGNCPGDSHGPECGHDVIHHDGHLDYVVNGRLIHPVQVDPAAAAIDGNVDGGTGTSGAPATLFEDHGSIQALDEDFVTFWSSFSLLSETADEEVLAFCDMCSSEAPAASNPNLPPVA